MQSSYLSPLRLWHLENLRNKLKCTAEEVAEAMKLRKNLPQLAEEYILNKNKTDLPITDQFPLWTQYLMMTQSDEWS